MSTNQPNPSTRIVDGTETQSVVKLAVNTKNTIRKALEVVLPSKFMDFKTSAWLENRGITKPKTTSFQDLQHASKQRDVANLGQFSQPTTSSMNMNEVSQTQTDVGANLDAGGKSEVKSKESATEFTCFPNLPLELRQEIWKDACYIPRVIDLWGVWLEGTMTIGHQSIWRTHMWKSYNAVPSILHTSREARATALKHYSLDFGSRVKRPLGPVTVTLNIAPKIYVNWACDVICPIKYIGGSHMDDLASKPVRYLAVSLLNRDILRHGLLDCAKLEHVWLFAEPAEIQYHRVRLEVYNRGFIANTPFKLFFSPLVDDGTMNEQLRDARIDVNDQDAFFFGCVKEAAEYCLQVKKINLKAEILYKLVHFEETGKSHGL